MDFAYSPLRVRGVMEHAPGINQIESVVSKGQRLCISIKQSWDNVVNLRVLSRQRQRTNREVNPDSICPRLPEADEIRSNPDTNLEDLPCLQCPKSAKAAISGSRS